jgi:hypothetical protein
LYADLDGVRLNSADVRKVAAVADQPAVARIPSPASRLPMFDGPAVLVSGRQVFAHRVEQFGYVAAGGVAVRECAGAAGAAEELVDRQSGHLALDVPQGDVDRRDGRRRHRAAPPVRASVRVLPGVLDGVCVASGQQGRVLAQVGRHGEFTAVQRGVAEAGQAVLGGDAQGDEGGRGCP